MLHTQNAVLVKALHRDLATKPNLAPSIFGNEPPATDIELEMALQTLLVAFPQMPASFWGIVAKEASKQGVSLKRMNYMVDVILNTHHYPTITLADIFDIDKYIHELTPAEFYALPADHKPLAQIFFGGKHRVVYKEDADAYGYPSEPFLSNAQREEQERIEDEQRHRKWMEQWQKDHPNEVPDTKDIDIIIGELSEEFSVNQKS